MAMGTPSSDVAVAAGRHAELLVIVDGGAQFIDRGDRRAGEGAVRADHDVLGASLLDQEAEGIDVVDEAVELDPPDVRQWVGGQLPPGGPNPDEGWESS